MSGLVQGSLVIELPEVLAEKLRRLGIDAETYVLDLLVRALKLDPGEEVRVRVELARRFLDEGRSLVDRDPVQASEKLYRATEECVKVLAQYLNLREILERVEQRGRWTVTDLEKAVEKISDRLGSWFRSAWDSAWYLHVLGFHEAKLDSEAVRRRLPEIEKVVGETRKMVGL